MFDQPSYLKGIGVGQRDGLRMLERWLDDPSAPRAARAYLVKVRDNLSLAEESNQRLYERVVQARDEREAAEKNIVTLWPAHARRCILVTDKLSDARDCTCGVTERGDHQAAALRAILGEKGPKMDKVVSFSFPVNGGEEFLHLVLGPFTVISVKAGGVVIGDHYLLAEYEEGLGYKVVASEKPRRYYVANETETFMLPYREGDPYTHTYAEGFSIS